MTIYYMLGYPVSFNLDQVENAFVKLDRGYFLIRFRVMLLLLCYIMGPKDTRYDIFSDNMQVP